MENIEHKQLDLGVVRVEPFEPANAGHSELSGRLMAYMEYAMLTAAAAVYVRTGTLDYAASALEYAGFDLPPWAEEHAEHDDPATALRAWVEDNQERILLLVDSTAAQTIARGDMFE
jgi:hypothetical protein